MNIQIAPLAIANATISSDAGVNVICFSRNSRF